MAPYESDQVEAVAQEVGFRVKARVVSGASQSKDSSRAEGRHDVVDWVVTVVNEQEGRLGEAA